VYDRYAYDREKQALETWARRFRTILEEKAEHGNVVSFSERSK